MTPLFEPLLKSKWICNVYSDGELVFPNYLVKSVTRPSFTNTLGWSNPVVYLYESAITLACVQELDVNGSYHIQIQYLSADGSISFTSGIRGISIKSITREELDYSKSELMIVKIEFKK